MKALAYMLIAVALAACAAPGPAPVRDAQARKPPVPPTSVREPQAEPVRAATPQIAPSSNGLHLVARGDTLYAIAFANSLDYRDLAAWNRLDSPDRILVGQTLRLTPPPGAVETRPLNDAAPPTARALNEPPLLRTPQAVWLEYSDANWAQVSATAVASPPAPASSASPPALAVTAAPPAAVAAAAAVDTWLWPADGALLGRFGAAGGKGIDIVAARNSPIKAAAPGKVVYSGSGLRGYGKLVIVKHAGEFLSAYAHNDAILVKEGDAVSAGQKIALMGDSGTDRVKLHFEIRRYGKPLDPLTYLPERS
ncbi:MAG: peptidoglycan DD-metalloendopeptidase family protein [Thiobacillus sp.]